MMVVLLLACQEGESLQGLMRKLISTLSGDDEEFKVIICDDVRKEQTQKLREEYA